MTAYTIKRKTLKREWNDPAVQDYRAYAGDSYQIEYVLLADEPTAVADFRDGKIMQVQYLYHHGPTYPPQGWTTAIFVEPGMAVHDTDIFLNRYPGPNLRRIGNRLVEND